MITDFSKNTLAIKDNKLQSPFMIRFTVEDKRFHLFFKEGTKIYSLPFLIKKTKVCNILHMSTKIWIKDYPLTNKIKKELCKILK